MKLSIITVSKNAEETIERTIKSVISQSYTDFEYIIIDGISTDSTIDIIKKYIDRLSYFISEPDSGIYSAMNKAIVKAKGDYCLFLNADDYLYNDKVIGNVFSKELDYDIIYGDVLYVTQKGTVLYNYPDNLSYYFLYSGTLCHQAQFIKRNLFSRYGLYDERYKINADYEFLLRIAVKNNATAYHIPDIVCVFNAIDTQTLRTPNKFVTSERKLIQNIYFSPKVMELLEEHHKLVNSDAVKFAKKIEKISFLKNLQKIILKILKWIYGTFYYKNLLLLRTYYYKTGNDCSSKKPSRME